MLLYIHVGIKSPLCVWREDRQTAGTVSGFKWIYKLYSWWRHQMETFSALLALGAGNSSVQVNSPHKGQWRGALMFSLICVRINDWENNREAGDLRRHRGHYDVNVMLPLYTVDSCFSVAKHMFHNIWVWVGTEIIKYGSELELRLQGVEHEICDGTITKNWDCFMKTSPWWRHNMDTLSALLAFSHQWLIAWSFDIFVISLNKLLYK